VADALNLQPGEIEIFRAGDYPQGPWPADRVKQIAETYDPVNEHNAYVKAGHKDGGMAYGLFSSLRTAGESLIAKLADATPQAVKDAFANGQVSGWSAEIYEDYKGTGKPYLKALAMLGATPPAIKGLKSALAFKESDHGPVAEFDYTPPPYVAEGIAEQMATDELRRELSDINWAFNRQVDRVMCATDLDAAQKRAELNRLAAELASLTEAEVNPSEEETQMAETTKTPATPEKPAGAPAQAPAPAQFSEAQFAELKEQNEKLVAKFEAQEKLIADLGRGALRSKIAAFSEQAKKDGKLIEGDVQAGVDQFMEAIEGVHFDVTKGDKTETVSALAWFQEHVGRRLAAVPEGVKSKGAKGAPGASGLKAIDGATPDSIEFAEAVQAYADEHKISYVKAYPIVAADRAKSA